MFYLDFVRAVALAAILVIHFNATVTGYFTLPHKLFASTLPFGIYLGDFGSSLFFMVSGAALALTVPPEQKPWTFYKKRARAIYPLFWLAWAVCFSLRFLSKPGYYAAAKTPTLLLTVLGLDNFAVAAGWVGMDFACVGEWFLGSILFLYLLFPLLNQGLRRCPAGTWAAAFAVCLRCICRGGTPSWWPSTFWSFCSACSSSNWAARARAGLAVLAAAGTVLCSGRDGKITCALFSLLVFTLLAAVSRLLDRPWPQAVCAYLAKISYAVFLVHHVLIQRMVERFDLAALGRRDTLFLFLIYLGGTWAAAVGLLWLHRRIQKGIAALRPQ